jgi:hypothetical protein
VPWLQYPTPAQGLTHWGLNVGLLEVSAATVEGAPTPGEPGNRSDIFLRQRAVTLGWNWRVNGGKAGKYSKADVLAWRLGVDLSGLAKLVITEARGVAR